MTKQVAKVIPSSFNFGSFAGHFLYTSVRHNNFMRLYTYTVTIDNVERDVLSVADPDYAFAKGLASKSIVGYLKTKDDELNPDNIIYNADFVELFKKIIKST